MVEGGKASTGPPLGPALGPLGLNLGQIVKEINEKTKDFRECRFQSHLWSSTRPPRSTK
ncbi:MAG: seg [Thermoplasmatales archaeon A-plasma]|nr:MAG: seg [Thermoplasmatales archaeon A-plasma]